MLIRLQLWGVWNDTPELAAQGMGYQKRWWCWKVELLEEGVEELEEIRLLLIYDRKFVVVPRLEHQRIRALRSEDAQGWDYKQLEGVFPGMWNILGYPAR